MERERAGKGTEEAVKERLKRGEGGCVLRKSDQAPATRFSRSLIASVSRQGVSAGKMRCWASGGVTLLECVAAEFARTAWQAGNECSSGS